MKYTIEAVIAGSRKAKRQRDNWKRRALAYEAEVVRLRNEAREAECDTVFYHLVRDVCGVFADRLTAIIAKGNAEVTP